MTAVTPDATAAPSATSAGDRGGILGPPGLLFYLVVALAILIALDTNSRISLDGLLITAPFWLLLAGTWLLRFVAAVWTYRGRIPRGHWLRWLAVPALLGGVFVLTRYNVPYELRLAASRGAMDQVAAEVAAGGSTDRSWVGLYPVAGVERIPGGIRFIIDDSLLGSVGFAYSSAGQPENVDDDPLWCCDRFESIGGGWWRWTQEWD
jgi:hypothetical protein